MIVVMLDIAKAFSMLANELDKQYAGFAKIQPPSSRDWITALRATAERITKDEQEERKPTRHLDI